MIGPHALPLPLTEFQSAVKDAYDLRYPGVGISPGRRAWRGQHEIERGRLSEADISRAPAEIARRRQYGLTYTMQTRIDGAWVTQTHPLYPL